MLPLYHALITESDRDNFLNGLNPYHDEEKTQWEVNGLDPLDEFPPVGIVIDFTTQSALTIKRLTEGKDASAYGVNGEHVALKFFVPVYEG